MRKQRLVRWEPSPLFGTAAAAVGAYDSPLLLEGCAVVLAVHEEHAALLVIGAAGEIATRKARQFKGLVGPHYCCSVAAAAVSAANLVDDTRLDGLLANGAVFVVQNLVVKLVVRVVSTCDRERS